MPIARPVTVQSLRYGPEIARTLGGGRAWHYAAEEWSYVELPMVHVTSAWLAPNSTLWVGGFATTGQGESASQRAVVATLALSSGAKVGLP